MEIIFAGFVLGIITSFHCAGMCGPIALALPVSGNTTGRKIFSGIIYNLGRTLTYVIAGVIFGLAGQSFNMLGFQQWVSIISGSLMILFGILPILFNANIESGLAKISFTRFIRNSFQRMFAKGTLISLFIIGILNGLLPCGPLYSALIAATGTGSVIQSGLFMFLFGLGTIPVIFVVTLAGTYLNQNIRKKAKTILPIFVIILGILFILRGAYLGIPFLSPAKEKIKAVYENVEQNAISSEKKHDCCSGR